MLTACLWRFGIAPTSPDPLWHPDGLSLFDASSSLLPDPVSKSSIPIKVSRYLGNVLASMAGFCNTLCKVGSLFTFAFTLSVCASAAVNVKESRPYEVCRGSLAYITNKPTEGMDQGNFNTCRTAQGVTTVLSPCC